MAQLVLLLSGGEGGEVVLASEQRRQGELRDVNLSWNSPRTACSSASPETAF